MDKSFYDVDEIKRMCEQMYKDVESQIVYLEDRLKYYDPLIEKYNNQSGLSAELRGRIRLNPRGLTRDYQHDFVYPFPGETAESSRDWLIANKIKLIRFLQEKRGETKSGKRIDVEKVKGGLQKEWQGNLPKETFRDFLEDNSRIGWITKECAENWESVFNDNFKKSLTACGPSKLVFSKDINWQQYYLWYTLACKYQAFDGLEYEPTKTNAGVFFSAHCKMINRKTGECEGKTVENVKKGIPRAKLNPNDQSDLEPKFNKFFELKTL